MLSVVNKNIYISIQSKYKQWISRLQKIFSVLINIIFKFSVLELIYIHEYRSDAKNESLSCKKFLF